MAREKMAREPVETMSRMDLMREVHHWREIGPGLKAVARAAERLRLHSKPLGMDEDEFWRNPQLNLPNQGSETLTRALARLLSLSKGRK